MSHNGAISGLGFDMDGIRAGWGIEHLSVLRRIWPKYKRLICKFGLLFIIKAKESCSPIFIRMFISQDMLPDVEAGIFLDNDMLVLEDPAILWDRFKLFTPFTVMAIAPVEAHYSREMVSTKHWAAIGKWQFLLSRISHLKMILSNNCFQMRLPFFVSFHHSIFFFTNTKKIYIFVFLTFHNFSGHNPDQMS